jgi:hypothetical protein
MAKPKKQPKPDASSGQYIINCNKPLLKFTVPIKEWIELQKEEEDNVLYQRNPRLHDPNAGTFMTPKMLQAMTHQFDGYGEYKTKDLEKAKAAYSAAKFADKNARLASTSIHFELDEERPEDDEEAA